MLIDILLVRIVVCVVVVVFGWWYFILSNFIVVIFCLCHHLVVAFSPVLVLLASNFFGLRSPFVNEPRPATQLSTSPIVSVLCVVFVLLLSCVWLLLLRTGSCRVRF